MFLKCAMCSLEIALMMIRIVVRKDVVINDLGYSSCL